MTVPYRCNRAVIFVSDQYHESLPFRFAPGKAPGAQVAVWLGHGPRTLRRCSTLYWSADGLLHAIHPGYDQRRVNLTLLFGDRWSKRLAHPDQDLKPSSAVGIDASAGWDVFDD